MLKNNLVKRIQDSLVLIAPKFNLMDMKKSTLKSFYPINEWLIIHTTHLAYVRNLILTLAVASLGFSISKYSDIDYTTTFAVKYCLMSAIILFGISLLLGLCIAIIQDKVFRKYREISRIIEMEDIKDDEKISPAVIDPPRNKCTHLENTNKCMFLIQLIFYGVGVILLTISVFAWK